MSEHRAPPGTHDVLPPESARWQRLIGRFARRVNGAGYHLVVSPLFEDLAVFQRVGEDTDVVRKEMYDFLDKGGRRIALRPEGTASVVRAFVQHRPQLPFKAWYAAPSFRYERPQAGRYRQHHQLGVEVLGSEDPELDVEIVSVAYEVARTDVGLRTVTLLLNSLGDETCRPAYTERLREYLAARADQLCDEHRKRYAVNPQRVLDCKREACITATAGAPRLVDDLCDACAAHFAAVRSGLDALGIPYRIEPRLVRGLDYYTRTTFELQASGLDTAQNAVGGGGRYGRLVEDMGGPPTPGIGFGLGIERLLLAADAEGVLPAPESVVDVWVIDLVGGREATTTSAELRAAGIATDRSFDQRSLKAQLKAADRAGARFAVIVGENEMAAAVATVRDLRAGDQEEVAREKLVDVLRERLGS
ncbi:MAG: histidine--tRNA ligase [Acidimicrobiales bacterium]